MMDDKLKTPPKMRAEQLEEAMQEPALQPSLNKFIDAFKGHKPDPNWYFYSNSPQFSDYFKKIKRMNLESPEKGALLLMDQDGEKTLLNQAVADAAKYLHVGLVFVEGKFVRVMSPRSESTCFSVAADPDMPSAEAVASALLQLKNNPSLFEKWRDWPAHTFKANGRMFRDEYQLIRDEP